jgi:uncharacterized membrane protein YdjX (TVP38/TMEM64 family)
VEGSRTRHRWIRFFLGVFILAVAVALIVSGVYESLSPEAIRARLLGLGPWGPVLFVVVFGALQPFGVSAHVFIIGASLVWSPGLGALLSWLGALAASSAAFCFARYMGRDWVQRRVPARMRAWDDRLDRDGFRTVLLLRLLFFTFGPMQLMLGVSKVRFVPFLFASALGLAPMIVLTSYVGSSLVAWVFSLV